MVHIVRINQSTIRENPDYSTQPREEIVSMQADFVATEEAMDSICERIKYPEWRHIQNYLITSKTYRDGRIEEISGVCSGSEIPGLMKSSKEWPGITITVTANKITHMADIRKYLFEYEAEPPFLCCGGCDSRVNTAYMEFNDCPVCETQLTEYENLDISMIP